MPYTVHIQYTYSTHTRHTHDSTLTWHTQYTRMTYTVHTHDTHMTHTQYTVHS